MGIPEMEGIVLLLCSCVAILVILYYRTTSAHVSSSLFGFSSFPASPPNITATVRPLAALAAIAPQPRASAEPAGVPVTEGGASRLPSKSNDTMSDAKSPAPAWPILLGSTSPPKIMQRREQGS